MIKIYCEDGAMTKSIKKLRRLENIELISFPFENFNKKTVSSKKPSNLTLDSGLWTWGSDIKFSNMGSSELFEGIEKIIGAKNFNDVRHVDTA